MINVGTAHHINTLLNYLLRQGRNAGRFVEDDEALKAAMVLAGEANKRLMAGITPETVQRLWPLRDGPSVTWSDSLAKEDAVLRENLKNRRRPGRKKGG